MAITSKAAWRNPDLKCISSDGNSVPSACRLSHLHSQPPRTASVLGLRGTASRGDVVVLAKVAAAGVDCL